MYSKAIRNVLFPITRLADKVHGIIRAKNPLNFRFWQYYMLLKGGELSFIVVSHSHVYHLVFPLIG